MIDANEYVDLANPVEVPEIIAATLFETERAVLELEGGNPSQALEEGYLRRLWTWLTQTDVQLGSGELSLPGGVGNFVLEMKSRPSLREQVRRTVAAHLTSFLKQAREEMTALEQRARKAGRGCIIVVFDQLEKLQGTSTTWYDVLDSAEQLFANGAPPLRLPVHQVFTVPTALLTRLPDVQLMPMVRVRNQDGTEAASGMRAMRMLIARRISDKELEALLGPACEERCADMIRWSGGYVRELVRLLRLVVQRSPHPLDAAAFRRLKAELDDDIRHQVNADAFPWLAMVARTKFLMIESVAHQQTAASMLSRNIVMRYENGDGWYDLHPSVYEIPGVRVLLDSEPKT